MTPRDKKPSGSASPSPQAQSSPTPQPSTASIGGFTFTAPTGSGSGGDLYGIGQWGGQTINLSGFPTAIVVALSNAGIDTTGMVKADDIVKALGAIKNTQAVAQLQQMLFYAGFYPASVQLSDLQLGSFGDKDVSALGNAVVTAGQTSQQLGTYLSVRANTGYAQGFINQTTGAGIKPLVKVSPTDEDAALRQAAQKILGHDPSSEDLAGFRAYYDQAYTQGQKDALAVQTPQDVSSLPDAAQLGGAMGRLGQGLTDAAEAPAQTILSQGESATAAEHDQLAAQTNILGNGRYQPGAGQIGYANSSMVTNPAYTAYANQRAQDLAAVGQVNGAMPGGAPTLTDAPDIGNAAEQYLREHEAAGIAQQTVASKYRTLLQILQGA